MLRRILPLLLAGLALPVAAQQPTPELQALDDALPGTLINDPYTFNWDSYGDTLKTRPMKAPDIPGQGALAFTVQRKGAQPYDAGTNVPITGGIAKGDHVHFAIWARASKADTADGKGILTVRINRNSGDYPGFGDQSFTVGSDWELYERGAVADMDLQAGEAVLGIQLAGAKQVVEIGQVYIMNVGRPAAAQ